MATSILIFAIWAIDGQRPSLPGGVCFGQLSEQRRLTPRGIGRVEKTKHA
jgi:hypothetical protein